MEISRREIDRVFTKFEAIETRCAHHRRGLVPDIDGKILFPIHTSEGKSLHGRAAFSFIKSTGLTNEEFKEFVKCTLSREAALKRIKQRSARDY